MASASDLSLDALTAAVGARFTVHGGAGDGLELSLAGVEDLKGTNGYESFALLFEGPPSPALSQAIYELESDPFGAQAIFLVPVAPKAGRARYEAVFNRLRS